MKIAVAGCTGNTGRPLVAALLRARPEVELVLMTRDRERVHRRGLGNARIAEGRLEDHAFVLEATQGADALYWMTPPNLGSKDYLAFQRRLADVAAHAIDKNRIARVVNLSSFGAHLEGGTGTIDGLRHVEQALEDATHNITHLRPAVFFENYAAQAEAIQHAGSIFLPVSAETTTAMVAARDVGEAAARLLLDASWTGRHVAGLHGPADLSFGEAATIISSALERPVRHVMVGPEQAREALIERGVAPYYAALVVELYRAIERGYLQPAEPRTRESSTPTTLMTYARESLRPLVRA